MSDTAESSRPDGYRRTPGRTSPALLHGTIRALCCATFLAAAAGLMFPSVLAAEHSAARNGVITIPLDSRLRFGKIECVARSTTYRYLVCLSFSGKYEVAVSQRSVVIVRARDGKVLYVTP